MTARGTLTARVLLICTILVGAAPVRAENEAAAGEAVFKKVCAPCHSSLPGKPAVGPDLHGVMGRSAGSLKDYPYSDALKSAKFTWTREKMFEWLRSPHEAVPDTKMMFAGIKGLEERDEVVKFLEQYKAN